jgi:lysophospholipase L1-like esterase
MTDLAAQFALAFRDHATDGVGSSDPWKPKKSELRALGSSIASEIMSRYTAPVAGVQSRTLSTPPVSPSTGQKWIVPAGATGAWSGQAGKVAEWTGSAYSFTAPNAVYSAYVLDEAQLYGYDGTAWKILTGASLGFPTVAAMALVTTAAANIRAIVESDIIAKTAYRGRSSNVARLVTSTPHGLTTGAKINVRNLGASGYNADQVTVTVVDYGTFTYPNSGANESDVADTGGQADRNGTYVSNGSGGWTWNGDPLLDPAIAAQLGKAETIVADISSLAALTQYVTTTGALSTTDANWRASPMLQAAPGEVYVFSGLGNTGVSSVTFYDASSAALETHVSASNSAVYSGSFTAPASTAFVRFCYGTLGAVPSSFRGSISGAPLYLATRGQAVELIGHATSSGYLGTTGVLASSDTNWIYSGFLPVAPDDTIIFTLYGNSAVGNVCFYDADKQFISAKIGSSVAPLADVVDGAIRAPAGSAYLRISTASAAFQPTLAQTVKLLTTSAATWEALRALADRVDSGQAVELMDYATNVGYFGPTGVFTSDANWVCTSLLPTEAGDAITYKLWGHSLVGSVCFFDVTGAFLSSVVGGVVGSLLAYLFEGVAVAPATTAYVRISTASAAFHPMPTQSARLPVTVGRVWGELNAAATVSFTLAPFEAPRQLQLKPSDKILLYGDSISSADYQGYAAAMADLTGVSVYAGGFSGYTTAQLAANAQLQRIWDYDAELVIVMIGGNDTGAAGTVGTFGAISGETIVPETDIGADYAGSTLIQAIGHIIRKFKARYDNIRVRANLTGSETEAERDAKIAPLLKPVLVLATSLPQKRVDSASAYSQSENWERKRRAIVECCDRYEVHCVDLMRETSLDMSVEPYWTAPTDTVNNRGVWYMDGLHPNRYLFRKMAEIICGSLGIAGPSLTARYQGLWNASTNSPTLASGVGTRGDYYIVTTAGSTTIDGVSGWQVGDWIIFNGALWQQLRPTDTATALTFTAGSGINISRIADEITIGIDPSDTAAHTLAVVDDALKKVVGPTEIVNFMYQSDNFNASPWGQTQVQILPTTVPAPYGNVFASKINELAVYNFHNLSQNFSSVSARTVISFSICVKADERTQITGWCASQHDAPQKVLFDLSNGTATPDGSNPPLDVPHIIPIDGMPGWYRCIMIGRVVTAGTYQMFWMITNSGSTAYTGEAGKGLYIANAQAYFGPSIRPFVSAGALAATAKETVYAGADSRSLSYISGVTTGFALQDDLRLFYICFTDSQSNAHGGGTDVLVSTTATFPGYALMGSNGPHAEGQRFTNLVDLIETGPNETAGSAWVNGMIYQILAECPSLPHFGYFNPAIGGKTITELKRGGPSYDHFIGALQDMCDAARRAGYRPVVLAGDWMGNESGTYAAIGEWPNQLNQLYRQMDEDIRRITGQTERWVLFLSYVRTSTGYPFSNSVITGNRQAAMINPNIRLAIPTHQFPSEASGATSVHMTNIGQNMRGQALARTVFREMFGPGWTEFRDARIWRSGAAEITVYFQVPGGNIVLDTSGAIVPNTGYPSGNYYGFRFADGSNSPPTITGHSIVGNDLVLTLSGAPSGHAGQLAYASETVIANSNVMGCLRNDVAYPRVHGYADDHDWCVPFITDFPL